MDRNVILKAVEILKRGECAEICLIVKTHGSSPGKAGNAMLVSKEGLQAGTIGGGILEYQSIQYCIHALDGKENPFKLETFYLHPNEARDLGAVCGGEDTLAFFLLKPTELELFEEARELLRQNRSFGLSVRVKNGSASFEIIKTTAYCQTVQVLENPDGFELYTPFTEKHRAIVFGAGHISEKLVPLLQGVDFNVTVVDDTDTFANRTRFPEATEIFIRDFSKAVNELSLSAEDFCVVVTRGHAADYECEKALLERPHKPAYIGVIGSKAKTRFVRDKLRADGFSEEVLDTVYAPIGLDIGAKTPSEIAIAIAAQMIKVRFESGKALR